MTPIQVMGKLAESHGFHLNVLPGTGRDKEAWLVSYSTRKIVAYHYGIPSWMGWVLGSSPKLLKEDELIIFLTR